MQTTSVLERSIDMMQGCLNAARHIEVGSRMDALWYDKNSGTDNINLYGEDKSNDFVKLAHSTGENGTIAVNLKNLLLAHFYE
ncbi:hypothetical protein TNCV_693691 [Trichonephila clavipes]|nr:hypothetical protein TNCV_693691 [Trichonephila clavipes]